MGERIIGAALLAAAALAASGPALAQSGDSPAGAPLVFFDIAGPEMESQAAFYEAVFGWDIAEDGSFSVSVASPLAGSLRVEPPDMGPVTERVLYAGVEDIDATIETIVAEGGAVVFPRMVVPGVVIIALFTDPAGNRMGLVEIADGAPVVPPAQ